MAFSEVYVVDVGPAASPSEDALPIVCTVCTALIDSYAADGMAAAVEVAAEEALSFVAVSSDGGVVAFGLSEAFGAVGDVGGHFEVLAAVVSTAVHEQGQQVELSGSSYLVGVGLGAAALPFEGLEGLAIKGSLTAVIIIILECVGTAVDIAVLISEGLAVGNSKRAALIVVVAVGIEAVGGATVVEVDVGAIDAVMVGGREMHLATIEGDATVRIPA